MYGGSNLINILLLDSSLNVSSQELNRFNLILKPDFRYNSFAKGMTSTLVRATKANKATMLTYVKALNAGGGTNMYDAVKLALDTLKRSNTEGEDTSGCQKLILFLTDGVNSGQSIPNSYVTPLFFKMAQNLDLRCVLVSAPWVLGPKHVSNPE